MTVQCRIEFEKGCAVSFRALKEQTISGAFNWVMQNVPNMDCVKKLELEVSNPENEQVSSPASPTRF